MSGSDRRTVFDVSMNAEYRRLARDCDNKCSYCNEKAGIVARDFDDLDVNVSNTYFCWNHWAEYLNQEFEGYVMKGDTINGRSR